ncbi:MAG: phosphatidate cytidylyltransferase [Planctomycetaceae bacterium]
MSQAASSSSGRGGLASRLVAGTVVLATFAALAWADAIGFAGAPPLAWLLPVVVLLASGAGHEVVRLAAASGHDLGLLLVPAGAAVIAVSPAVAARLPVPDDPLAVVGPAAVATMAVVATILAAGVARYAPGSAALARVSGSIAAAVAIGLPFAFMVALRLVGAAYARGPGGAGLVPLLSLVAVVKAGDIAAYAVGSTLGRHRMAPLLSPGKTWEGCAASVAGSLLAAWLVLDGWPRGSARSPLGGWMVFGAVVGAAGIVGDLAESLVKRELAAKDSGRLLGAMGGCLDLVDSLLLAAPVAWLLWAAG